MVLNPYLASISNKKRLILIMKRIFGIIGGSGLYQIEGLENIKWKKVNTSWGEPSDRILSATLNKKELYFIQEGAVIN